MPDSSQTDSSRLPVVGVVPMAGQATHFADLTCSKEILPVKVRHGAEASQSESKAVCEHLLDQMHRSGIQDIYVVIRDGKWDIPSFLGDGSRLGLRLAYLMMGRPFGTPYSVDQAYTFVRDRRVALGFPDMCFDHPRIFTALLAHQETSGADLVPGVFPADRPQKVDMLELGADHRIRQLIIKPAETTLEQTWGTAIWTPVFTEFMYTYLDSHQHAADRTPEMYIGDVVRDAIHSGMDVQGIPVADQPFLDIGTREDLERASD